MSAPLFAIALANAVPATVRCGAVERPGVALRGPDGVWRGRAVDMCAAAAKAAFGPTARIAFHGYETGLSEAKDDEIAFLSAAEVDALPLQGAMRAGPVMAYSTQILLVPKISALQSRKELAGRLVCFMIGSAAEDALDEWAVREDVPIERLGFQEPDEMHDAYASGKCAAMAVDRAVEGTERGVVPFASRSLGEPMSHVALFAAFPAAVDQAWRAVVMQVTVTCPKNNCVGSVGNLPMHPQPQRR